MNVRLGFARLARVTAIAYGLVTAVVLAIYANDNLFDRERGALGPATHDFKVRGPSGAMYTVRAVTGDEAIKLASESPGVEKGDFSPIDQNNRFAKLVEPTHIYTPYDFRKKFGEAASNIAVALFWVASIYGVFWAISRGVRWVASGFMESSDQARSRP